MQRRCRKIRGETDEDFGMAARKKWNPGKRLSGNPLGEVSDSLLEEWCFYTRSSRSEKIKSSMNYAIKQNLSWIEKQREMYAQLRGISPDEMRRQILEGEASYLSDDSEAGESAQEDED